MIRRLSALLASASLALAPCAIADTALPPPNGYGYYVVLSCGSAVFSADTWRPPTQDVTGKTCVGTSGSSTGADQTASNSSDGQAPRSDNQHATIFTYIFNGVTGSWDRARGLNGTQYVATPDLRSSGTFSAVAGTTLDVPLNGVATAGLRFSGLTTSGAQLIFSTSNDGGTTYGQKNTVNCGTGVPASVYTTDGQPRLDVAGATNLRVSVSTGGTGTISYAYNLSSAALDCPNGPTPPSSNSIGASGVTSAAGGVVSRVRLTASTAGTNVTLVKTGIGRLYKIYACNTTTSDKFVKFYDTATSPVVGTTAVFISRILPRSPTAGAPLCQSFDQENVGWSFANGLYFSMVGTAGAGATYGADSDTTAVAAGDVVQMSVEYQ